MRSAYCIHSRDERRPLRRVNLPPSDFRLRTLPTWKGFKPPEFVHNTFMYTVSSTSFRAVDRPQVKLFFLHRPSLSFLQVSVRVCVCVRCPCVRVCLSCCSKLLRFPLPPMHNKQFRNAEQLFSFNKRRHDRGGGQNRAGARIEQTAVLLVIVVICSIYIIACLTVCVLPLGSRAPMLSAQTNSVFCVRVLLYVKIRRAAHLYCCNSSKIRAVLPPGPTNSSLQLLPYDVSMMFVNTKYDITRQRKVWQTRVSA